MDRPNVLITGGGGGIGRAAARRLAGRMNVVVADLDPDRAEEVAEAIRREGGRALAVEVDVASRESVFRMVDRAVREVGPIHALFNNAGINLRTPVERIPEEEWDRMMDVHVKGTFLCCQAVLPGMCRMGRGAIVNMASDYAVMGMPGAAAYAAAKTAIYSLTKSLALEFAPFGIRVNALGPGPIETSLLKSGRTAEEWEQVRARFFRRIPMGRLGRPEEVASVLDFLLSDRSGYITGQIIHPNGGQLMW